MPASRLLADSDPQQQRVLRTLVGAQILSGAGLAAGVSVGALLAAEMLGSDGLAGIPSALFTIGSAGAAAIVGHISGLHGRRRGLRFGYMSGAAGAALVVLAAAIGSVLLLLPALLIYGAGTATNLQARYAGGDLATPERSGRALSTVLLATTVGAVAGPNLVSPMGKVAKALGVPALGGPFILAAVAYGLAALVLSLWLHPDPLLLARERHAEAKADASPATHSAQSGPQRETIAGPQTPPGFTGTTDTATDLGAEHDLRTRTIEPAARQAIMLGGFIMVIAQLVMVAIMTMTPVHMLHHGHSLGAAGAVIAAHIAGMYLPSPLTGMLVDRIGARSTAFAAAATLALSGVLAATVPSSSTLALGAALAVLGIGWNLGLLSGTALVTGAAPISARARIQGRVDVAIAIAGAGAGLGSGVVVSSASYTVLGFAGAALALTLVPVVALGAGRGNADPGSGSSG